jgi:tetratricopeptide (TPR) repeat protein
MQIRESGAPRWRQAMSDPPMGHISRSSKRSIAVVVGSVVAGIGIGLAATQVAHGQDLVPAPPVVKNADDPVSELNALPRKKDENLLLTNVLAPATDTAPETRELLGDTFVNPFAKAVGSGGRGKVAPSDDYGKANALLWKAYACDQDKQFDKELEYYNKAIASAPAYVDAYRRRARTLIQLGRFSEALLDLNFVIRQEADSFEDYVRRGYALHRLVTSDSNDAAFKRALADITRALELKPDDPYARSVRGAIAARRGDYDGAIADLTWALDHKHDSGEARYYRGRAFAMKGEIERAIADLTDAVKRYPKCVGYYTYRVQLYAQKQDFEHALADFDQVVRLQPDRPQWYLERAMLLLLKGDKRRALADTETVIRLVPDSAMLHFVHAIALYLVEPKTDRALAEMDKVIALDPQVILYPAFRCFLNGKKARYGLVLKDLAFCTAILAKSQFRYHVYGDQEHNHFEIRIGEMIDDRCALRFLGRIDFEQSKFMWGVGFMDNRTDEEHKNQVSETDQQLINQNVLNRLAATFAGAAQLLDPMIPGHRHP